MTLAISDFDYISSLVDRHSAIVLPPEKQYLVESRLTPLARDLGLDSIGGLVSALRTGRQASLETKVVEAMTTNETSWFRDRSPFDALQHHALPDVIERNRPTRTLRIWSAASSTGQELYSVAMLLDSAFPELQSWSTTLLGTDLSTAVVERARAGRYSSLEVNRGLPAHMLTRYMQRDGRDFRIVDDLRSGTRFEQQNLIHRWPPRPQFDIVLLRNVLIYFDSETKRTILSRLLAALTPGGYLVLGTAETTLGISSEFAPVATSGAVIYQKKGQ